MQQRDSVSLPWPLPQPHDCFNMHAICSGVRSFVGLPSWVPVRTSGLGALQNWDGVRPQNTALGSFEGRAGEQSMNVRFCLTAESQAGNPIGTQRCAADWTDGHLMMR